MSDALIGWSGFVGGTMLRQRNFDDCYRSTDIEQIEGRNYDCIVCAGAPAQKWLANRDPAGDKRKIDGLIERLNTVRAKRFILISTVDVFAHPIDVDESTSADDTVADAYGLHRRQLERFVQSRFDEHLIVRLPGLVGPGLRKNVIYDLVHDNNVSEIDRRHVFQFYPMVNLWPDIEIAIAAGLKLVHLTAEPISVQSLVKRAFARTLTTENLDKAATRYDFRTVHGELYGTRGMPYQYTAAATVLAARELAQNALLHSSK